MRRKLPNLLFGLGIFSFLFVLLGDIPFFVYVRIFGLRPATFYTIDYWLSYVDPILLLPAAYTLFRLLRLNELSGKSKLIVYLSYGFILSLLYFPAIFPTFGQLAGDYRTWTELFLPRFYWGVILLSVTSLFIWMPLTNIVSMIKSKNKSASLKELGATLALIILSLIVSAVSISVLESQKSALLEQLLGENRVEKDLPQLSGYTNQPIIITDHPGPLFSCYLKQNPNDLYTKIITPIVGKTFREDDPGYNSFYLNDHCLVVYLGVPLTLVDTDVTTSAALLSEMLIRLTFKDDMRLNADKSPARTITIKGDELWAAGASRGSFDTDTKEIELQEGYGQVFETIIHELLHAFSAVDISSLNPDRDSGLDEAVTEYLTGKIMRYIGANYDITMYVDEVRAFEELLQYVDEKVVFDAYFNGSLRSLQSQVDGNTYDGAFCRFYHYLDRAMIEHLENRNYVLTEEYANKAATALTLKEDDVPGCL